MSGENVTTDLQTEQTETVVEESSSAAIEIETEGEVGATVVAEPEAPADVDAPTAEPAAEVAEVPETVETAEVSAPEVEAAAEPAAEATEVPETVETAEEPAPEVEAAAEPETAAPEETESTALSAAEDAASAADAVPEAPTAGASETETESPAEEPTAPLTLETLKAGMRVKGTVRNKVDFGAFIDIGVGRDGLAHVSTLKRAGIDESLQVGDEIDVQIRRVDMERGRISLTIPGAGRGSKTSLEDLKQDVVVPGRIVRLVDFGAFVDIGAQTDGLLHISQLPGGFVRHPSEVVQVGQEVQVRILEVDMDRRRISLSMKTGEESGQQRTARPQRQRGPERGPRGQRPSRSRRSSAPQQMTVQDDSGERAPTAFEVAWQEAMGNSRRRPRGGRR